MSKSKRVWPCQTLLKNISLQIYLNVIIPPTTIPFLITFRAFIYITSSLSKKEFSSDRRFHNSKHLPPSKNEQHTFTKEEIKDSNTYLN